MNVILVDQDGTDMTALRTVIKALREGNRVLIFPEGSRSHDGGLQEAQPGLGLVIAKTGAPVVPMRIFGAHETMPRGTKKFRPKPVTIVVGEPIHFSEEELRVRSRSVYAKLSRRVMEAIEGIQNERSCR